MSGYAAEYIASRTVLLDALEALGTQLEAMVVVGAQAVYIRTGDAGISGVAPYTTDADFALEPAHLADEPHLETLLLGAAFHQKGDPGIWFKTVDVRGAPTEIEVDVMVPERFAPPGGRRSVRLPPHDKMIARKASGLEGALVDRDLLDVGSLDSSDPRRFTVWVAGPAALVVAKLHKLRDRLVGGRADRIADKDAADVYRLMLTVPVREFHARLKPMFGDEAAGPPSHHAVELLAELFGAPGSVGVRMAADALRVAVPAARVADVCTGFVRQVRETLDST